MTRSPVLLFLLVAACKSAPAGHAGDGGPADAVAQDPDSAARPADATALDTQRPNPKDGALGDRADAAAPACPRDPPVPRVYPFTPLACPIEASAGHLLCPYDVTSGRLAGCHVEYQCLCVSSQQPNVPPTCSWNPGQSIECPDAGVPDAAGDAGPIACGASTCPPDQYCVTSGGGPAPRCFPHLDGGACPGHTREGCSYPPGPGCEEVREPGYECRGLPAACAAQEPCDCICHLAPGPAGGCFVTGRQVSCEYP